jgi:hypothetical protein
MRKIFAICILLLPAFIYAQDPVKWNNTVKKINETTFEIHLKASVQSPWHIYSQKTPKGGPLATEISFIKNPIASYTGTVQEKGTVINKREEVFGIDVMYYDKEVDFVQTVKLKGKIKTNIKGTLNYMVCNDKQCMPPAEIQFDLPIQ